MKKVKLFKQTVEIGGYNLPADFVYLDNEFLNELVQLGFSQRYVKVYEYFSNRKADLTFFEDFQTLDFPLSVISLDENIAALELTDGKLCDFNDYILDKSDLFGKICSWLSIITSSYIDLKSTEVIGEGEIFNVACPLECGELVISLAIAKKIGLPIGTIILGGKREFVETVNDVYISMVLESEEDELISLVFEDYGYLFDPYSARGFIAQDNFYDNYEDDRITLIFSLVSPYKYARRIYKILTGKNEIDIKKSMKGILEETALDVPINLKDNKVLPFFNENKEIDVKDVFTLLKYLNKV